MISLNEIVSSNIEMLKEQEASLENSLDFVRRAIQLFESQGNGSATVKGKRGRPRRNQTSPAFASTASSVKATRRTPRTRNRKDGKHIDRIFAVLKDKKGPISSADLIQNLFKSQSKDRDIKHFSTLIYPVLTKAYKNRALKLKSGKIYLG